MLRNNLKAGGDNGSSVAERAKNCCGLLDHCWRPLDHSFQIPYPSYWSHSVKEKILWHRKQSHS